jgi:fido (protein-threonine AMPylation protein)
LSAVLGPYPRPGKLKEESNRFGCYDFVAPNLVRGTLERGLACRDRLALPFTRATFMMFLVAEVHPFDDGNGRLARLVLNAELSAAGEHRILVPIITRNDYLQGLRRLSRDGDPDLLLRVLATNWSWSSQGDYSSLAAARDMLEQTNALVDAADAERVPADLRASGLVP